MESGGRSKIVPFDRRWQHFLGRGLRSLRAGNHAAAVDHFERALQIAPDEPTVQLALGRELMRQGRFHEAEPLLRDAWQAMPASETAVAALARLLGLHLHRREEAFQLLEQALDSFPDSAPLHMVQGELLLEDGAFADARTAFTQALDEPMAAEAARVGLARTFNAEGIALSERGALDAAVFAFKRAADLEPEWAGPHVNLGVVFGRMNRPSKAAEAYIAALERDPENPVACFNLGTVQHKRGKHQEAVRAFEELLQLAPDYPHVRSTLANVLGELKEFDRAIALLLEELEIEPDCASCWSSLGLAYVCTGNVERGEQCLRRALQLDPGYFNAIHNLASLYVTQKRYEEAETILRRAFDLDPRRTTRLLATDNRLRSVRNMDRFRFLC
jgi:Flp pilus assembly protein TadD